MTNAMGSVRRCNLYNEKYHIKVKSLSERRTERLRGIFKEG